MSKPVHSRPPSITKFRKDIDRSSEPQHRSNTCGFLRAVRVRLAAGGSTMCFAALDEFVRGCRRLCGNGALASSGSRQRRSADIGGGSRRRCSAGIGFGSRQRCSTDIGTPSSGATVLIGVQMHPLPATGVREAMFPTSGTAARSSRQGGVAIVRRTDMAGVAAGKSAGSAEFVDGHATTEETASASAGKAADATGGLCVACVMRMCSS